MLRAGKPHAERQSVRVATPPSRGRIGDHEEAVHRDQGRTGWRARARLLPAIAAGERIAGDPLVSPDEHVPVDAAPAEAEARCRGKRVWVVRVRGVAVGRVRIAWNHSRSGEEGGRPEVQASLSEGWSGEHDGPEADHEGLHRLASYTEARHRGTPAVALRPETFRSLPPARTPGRSGWRTTICSGRKRSRTGSGGSAR